MWREPVWDRTAEDIATGRAKGFCNATDLNRLEENCGELSHMLGISLRLRASPWSRNDLPTVEELGRVTDNIRLLREGYTAYQATPLPPAKPLNHWRKWNDAEKILLDLHRNRLDNRAAVRYCGELTAGERIGIL